MKRSSTMEAVIPAGAQMVWDIVTDRENTVWRSDLSKTECVSENCFTEYTVDNAATQFVVTEQTPVKRYAFTMENKFFSGVWEGRFQPCPQGTKLCFTEELHIHNPIIWALSFIMMPLKKIQRQYMSDLAVEVKKRAEIEKST